MPKTVNPTPSQIEYMKRRLAQVAADRAQPPSKDEIAQILLDLGSPDSAVKAAALQRICPCHLEWATLEPLRKAAKKLQKDPDPTVQALAFHIEQDAEEIASLEAMRDRLEEEGDGGWDLWKEQERKRNKHRHRSKDSAKYLE